MSSTQPNTPAPIVMLSEAVDLPAALTVERLSVRDLDTCRASAVRAAGKVGRIVCCFLDWHEGLCLARAALDQAASESQRAATAREHLETALRQAEEVCAELCDAQDALDFHWS